MSFRNVILSCLVALLLVQLASSQSVGTASTTPTKAANGTTSGTIGTEVDKTFGSSSPAGDTTVASPAPAPVGSPRYLGSTYGYITNQTNENVKNAAVNVAGGLSLLIGSLGGVALLVLAL